LERILTFKAISRDWVRVVKPTSGVLKKAIHENGQNRVRRVNRVREPLGHEKLKKIGKKNEPRPKEA
jgi:hypothetical protein